MARTTSIANSSTEGALAAELGRRPWDACPDVLLGVLRVGPWGSGGSQLSFELGMSAWWRRSGGDLGRARFYLFEVRGALIEAGGLDPDTEPLPLVGRSDRADLLAIAVYLADLLYRAASASGCDPEDLSHRVLARLEQRGEDRLDRAASRSR